MSIKLSPTGYSVLFFFSLLVSYVYLGQNEGCSLRNKASDSSERLLRRGSEGRSIHKILMKGEFNAIKALSGFSVLRADVIMKGSSTFLDMKRCKYWDHEISS